MSSVSNNPDLSVGVSVPNHVKNPGTLMVDSIIKNPSSSNIDKKIHFHYLSFTKELTEAQKPLSLLVSNRNFQSMHELLSLDNILFQFLEEYTDYYKLSFPEDTTIIDDLRIIKLEIGNYYYNKLYSLPEETFLGLLKNFQEKLLKANIDVKEFQRLFDLFFDLLKKPKINQLQLISLFHKSVRVKSFLDRKEGIEITFPISSIHQLFHLLAQRGLQNYFWMKEELMQICEKLAHNPATSEIALQFDLRRSHFTYIKDALIAPAEIQSWLRNTQDRYLSLLQILSQLDLENVAEMQKIAPELKNMVNDLNDKFPNHSLTIGNHRNEQAQGGEAIAVLEELQKIHILIRLHLNSNLRLMEKLLKPLQAASVALKKVFGKKNEEKAFYLAEKLPIREGYFPQISSVRQDLSVDDLMKDWDATFEKKTSGTNRSAKKGKKPASSKKKKKSEPVIPKQLNEKIEPVVEIPHAPLLSSREMVLMTCMKLRSRYPGLAGSVPGRQAWWHFDQLILHYGIGIRGEIPPEKRLNSLIQCSTHAAWTLEQMLRPLGTQEKTHNLKSLYQISRHGTIPPVIQELFQANNWGRYYREYLRKYNSFSMIHVDKAPRILDILVKLAKNPVQLSSKLLQEEIFQITKQTSDFLNSILPEESSSVFGLEEKMEKRISYEDELKVKVDYFQEGIKSALKKYHHHSSTQVYNKFLQIQDAIRMLDGTLQDLTSTESYAEFSIHVVRALQLLQHIMSEPLTILYERKFGQIPKHHEVLKLTEELQLIPFGKELAGLSAKVRYPIEQQAQSSSGRLVDKCCALMLMPGLDTGFKYREAPFAGTWELPLEEVSVPQIYQELKELISSCSHIFVSELMPLL